MGISSLTCPAGRNAGRAFRSPRGSPGTAAVVTPPPRWSLRRRGLGLRLLAHEFGDGQVIDLAGAEQRQLVEHDDFRRQHQFGGMFAARISLELAAGGAVLVGDKNEPLALA